MKENRSSQERDRWADEHFEAVHIRDLPWEDPPWRKDSEEPLGIAAVFYALMAIRKGKSRALKPGSLSLCREQIFDFANWEEINRPPEEAVRIITRALQAGVKGEKMIKKALELKPPAKGAILARQIARALTEPKEGWPKNEEDRERLNSGAVEWIKPSKRDVERELARLYPEIYDLIPKKNCGNGKLLRSNFWNDAGLKDAIHQGRGYR
jgi:hypothetical protein